MEEEVTIELYERYLKNVDYKEWCDEFMPKEFKFKPEYGYRRHMARIKDIDRIIHIEGNDKECIVRFYGGEKMVVMANFDELCILFNDLCNSNLE